MSVESSVPAEVRSRSIRTWSYLSPVIETVYVVTPSATTLGAPIVIEYGLAGGVSVPASSIGRGLEAPWHAPIANTTRTRAPRIPEHYRTTCRIGGRFVPR